MAHRLDAELFVVYVDTGLDDTETNRKSLQANIKFSEDLGAQIVKMKATTVSEAVAKFVRRETYYPGGIRTIRHQGMAPLSVSEHDS